MRALRMSVVGTMTMALVGGLSVGLVAQEEQEVETPTATYVTGTIIQSFESGDSESWAEGGVVRGRGMMTETVVEWSDPRLPSRLLRNINVDEHRPSGTVTATSVRLEPLRQAYREGQEHLLAPGEGPDGVWVGTARTLFGYPADEPPRLMIYGLMALTGEGVYEGLSVVIANTWKGSTPALEGYIFEGDLPPMPDPIDPNTPPVE